jgi:hypothetical protein
MLFSPLLIPLPPHPLFYSHNFYYLSFNVYANNFYFPNILLFIDSNAKDFTYNVNNRSVNLLLPCLSPCTNIKSKWILDHYVKPQTLKLVQLREKSDKWDYMKLKSFCTSKETAPD